MQLSSFDLEGLITNHYTGAFVTTLYQLHGYLYPNDIRELLKIVKWKGLEGLVSWPISNIIPVFLRKDRGHYERNFDSLYLVGNKKNLYWGICIPFMSVGRILLNWVIYRKSKTLWIGFNWLRTGFKAAALVFLSDIVGIEDSGG
jgi:hypothetical protein